VLAFFRSRCFSYQHPSRVYCPGPIVRVIKVSGFGYDCIRGMSFSNLEISILDYGMGNIGSICNSFSRLGVASTVVSKPSELESAHCIVIPGVGSFDEGMKNLEQLGLLGVLRHKALVERVPVLGICLGMQLMTQSSEEGVRAGLGWFSTSTCRFPADVKPLPHMGWRQVAFNKEHPLIAGISEDSEFYFVHSYFPKSQESITGSVLGRSLYGGSFIVGLASENLMGVQFHPEKSHGAGTRLLRNFVQLAERDRQARSCRTQAFSG
jgi:imidazole glycerol-phosphate synthase subunit HisH